MSTDANATEGLANVTTTTDLLDAYAVMFLGEPMEAEAAGIIDGDCIERMTALPDASVDAIVTDPPYGLGFMGKAWDDLPPGVVWARECLRVLKPGGHVLAFGGTRTYHRLACAIEDAGFEIRDTLCWLYGSGFPKSLDVSKAIDKAAGVERKPGEPGRYATRRPREDVQAVSAYHDGIGDAGSALVTAPATPDAERWNGWGTALKPAHEPIVLARKPLAGTVAGNVLAHGTGALNVDGCRIEGAPRNPGFQEPDSAGMFGGADNGALVGYESPSGRWPANVALDPEAAAMLDAQAGERAAGRFPGRQNVEPGTDGTTMGRRWNGAVAPERDLDSGGASRFFYVAKASSAERNAGLDGFEERDMVEVFNGGMAGASIPLKGSPPPRYRNVHPTVKPIELMRWLVRLVTPPGGLVLDPFTGSGTTGIACALEGLEFVGFERESEYADIARARLAWWKRQPRAVADALAAEADRERVRATGQMELVP